ncbi:MAG TPA: FkbM family methyltransferase [Gemmatimonadaceae bacterium]|nr:FkbM family methyltransferase [Gemmatimonadaceae bacterium]
MSLLARSIDVVLTTLLTRQQRERLGRHITNVVRGEGNSDPATNGEYIVLDSLRRRWNSAGVRPVIFDVGANVGNWSSKAVTGLKRGADVYAFEPSLETFRILSAKSFIKSFNYALGDRASRARLYVSEESGTAETNTLHKRRAEAFGLKQRVGDEVEVKRGDDVAQSLGISHIDLTKIDTEGNEVAVLRGFSEMLARKEIDYVQFEYGGTWADSRTLLMDAFDLLLPLGYRLAKIHPAAIQVFERYDQGQETFTFANYLAIREGLLSPGRDSALLPISALSYQTTE